MKPSQKPWEVGSILFRRSGAETGVPGVYPCYKELSTSNTEGSLGPVPSVEDESKSQGYGEQSWIIFRCYPRRGISEGGAQDPGDYGSEKLLCEMYHSHECALLIHSRVL